MTTTITSLYCSVFSCETVMHNIYCIILVLIYLYIFLYFSCLRDIEMKIRVNDNYPGFEEEINQYRKSHSFRIVSTQNNFFILM